jgi:hypothetical protein
MSKRKRPQQVELDEEVMLGKAWAEKLAAQHSSTLRLLYGDARKQWVREQLGFLDPTDNDIRAVVGWLDGMVPYSPLPADSPPADVPWLYR